MATGTRRRFKVAAIQMTSTAEVDRNLREAERLVRGAAASGADLIALPENFAYLRPEGSPMEFKTEIEGDLVRRMGGLARETGCYLLLGSIPERIPRSPRVHNTSVLLSPAGRRLAFYRKIHLFDVKIRGGVSFRESRTVAPGDRPVVARTPLGRFGLTVCYDLRFPELYRRLAFDGAQVIFVPAAFTSFTGPHHWMPLLRARAIENQCWIVAPAQVGHHGGKRWSHGETAIVDPWGKVTARLPRARRWAEAEIDLTLVDRVRRGLPCLDHARMKADRFTFDK